MLETSKSNFIFSSQKHGKAEQKLTTTKKKNTKTKKKIQKQKQHKYIK